jgi:hypothetical protein
MSTNPSQWRISNLTKDGFPLTKGRWDASDEEQAERHRCQIEFRDKLAALMRENGYGGTIVTPNWQDAVTIKARKPTAKKGGNK